MTNGGSREGDLTGRQILIVEDEYYLAEDIAHALEAAGADVIGPVGTLDEAEAAVARGGFECAILDINLRGDMAFPIADRLEAAGIPFVIASGYNEGALPERFGATPRVEKPFDPAQLIATIPALLADNHISGA
jgi:DNA-binding response OmpR family regulator